MSKRAIWRALQDHHVAMQGLNLKTLFANDLARGDWMIAEAAGIYFDYSKNRVSDETLKLLVELLSNPGCAPGSTQRPCGTLVAAIPPCKRAGHHRRPRDLRKEDDNDNRTLGSLQAEGYRTNTIILLRRVEGGDNGAGRQVPHIGTAVVVTDGHDGSVWAKRHGLHTLVSRVMESGNDGTGDQIPQISTAVVVTSGQDGTFGIERHRLYATAAGIVKYRGKSASGQIP